MNKAKVWYTCIDNPYFVGQVGFQTTGQQGAVFYDSIKHSDIVVTRYGGKVLLQRVNTADVGEIHMMRDKEIYDAPIHPVWTDKAETLCEYLMRIPRKEIAPIIDEMADKQTVMKSNPRLPARGTWAHYLNTGKTFKPYRESHIERALCFGGKPNAGLNPEAFDALDDPNKNAFILVALGIDFQNEGGTIRLSESFGHINTLMKRFLYTSVKRVDVWDAPFVARIMSSDFLFALQKVIHLWDTEPPF